MGINDQEELESKYGSVEEGLAHEEGIIKSSYKSGSATGAITQEVIDKFMEKENDEPKPEI